MRSIPIPKFYGIWRTRLLQEVSDECDSRLENLIWLMMEIYLAGSVQLDLIARKVPIRAKKLSIVKRLHRFLDNAAVRVRTWYRATAICLIQSAASGGQVRLIIDCSKVSQQHGNEDDHSIRQLQKQPVTPDEFPQHCMLFP